MDNKISIKFESGMYEQTYKFREMEGLNNMVGIKKLVTETFSKNVLKEFQKMHELKNNALIEFLPKEEEDEFEEIT
ncbi:MAG TPA: hypothetical protein ENJ53_11195 [Phaeodactylibacter sp.]|nr:hypothetical protein [Phaeodactylibacter sp.]